MSLGVCPRIEILLWGYPFGPFSRSFSLNRAYYSPKMIKNMNSIWLSLATASILGQAPRVKNPKHDKLESLILNYTIPLDSLLVPSANFSNKIQ